MADSVSPDIQAKLSALCKQVSVAHELDPDIQKELYGHMEDKLLAYLNGKEPLTDDDALILVREHFGDPAVIKDLFGRVHAWESHITVARRLAAVFILQFALLAPVHMFHMAASGLAMLWLGSGNESSLLLFGPRAILPWMTLYGLAIVVTWLILRGWQQAIERHESLWFLEWSPARLVGLLALLYFVEQFAVTVQPSAERLQSLFPEPFRMTWTLQLAQYAMSAAGCALVLWWCDRPPRRPRAVLYALLAWLGSVLAPVFLYASPVRLLITQSELPFGFFERVYGASFGSFLVSGVEWHVSLLINPLPALLTSLSLYSPSLSEYSLSFGRTLLQFAPVLWPGIAFAAVYGGFRFWQSGAANRLRLRTRFTQLVDATYLDDKEGKGGGPDAGTP
jgi:hypothetical protein